MALLYDDERYDRFSFGDFKASKTATENYNVSSEVSSHPREYGTNVSDGVQRGPLEVQISGVVTDAALGGADIGSAQRAFEALLELTEEQRPLTLSSARGDFENMVISNLSMPVESPGMQRINLSLVQVSIVQAGTTVLPGETVRRSEKIRSKETGLSVAQRKEVGRVLDESPTGETQRKLLKLMDIHL